MWMRAVTSEAHLGGPPQLEYLAGRCTDRSRLRERPSRYSFGALRAEEKEIWGRGGEARTGNNPLTEGSTRTVSPVKLDLLY